MAAEALLQNISKRFKKMLLRKLAKAIFLDEAFAEAAAVFAEAMRKASWK